MRAVLIVILAAGCAAHGPVSGLTTIPRDSAATCESVCRDMGLTLGAVVVMANEVGCVCEKPGAAHAPGASAAAMGTIIAIRMTDVNREESWAGGF